MTTPTSASNPGNQFARHNPQYPTDTVSVMASTHHFNGSITNREIKKNHNQTDTQITYIDGAVRVESVDEKTSNAAKLYFASQAERAVLEKKINSNEFYLSVGASILGVGFSIGSIFIPIIGLSIAGILAGVALTALGITNALNKNSTIDVITNDITALETLKSQWKDPVLEVITHRKKANDQGFQYVYNNNLKGIAFHQEEVEGLWLQNFAKLLGRQQTIGQMCKENLMGQEAIKFAWNRGNLPDLNVAGRSYSASELHSMSLQFSTCRSGYLNFEAAINNELKALSNQKSKIEQEINQARTCWLLPAQNTYMQNKQSIDSLYNESILPFTREKDQAIAIVRQSYRYEKTGTLSHDDIAYKNELSRLRADEIQHIERNYNRDPQVVNIENAYRNDIRTSNFLHTQSQLVVNAFFNKRVNALDTAYNTARLQIKEQQKSGTNQFKNLMNNVLRNTGMLISPAAMPSVHRNWSLPNLAHAPTWNEVYGRPSFQSSFSSDVSELAWNHFWSGQGLGIYSSHPASAWDGLQLNNRLASHNQWFNLRSASIHASSQNARAGMFMREIRMPQPPRADPQGDAGVPLHQPVGIRTAHGFGGTERREEVKVPVGTREDRAATNAGRSEAPKTEAGTRTAHGFGGSERR